MRLSDSTRVIEGRVENLTWLEVRDAIASSRSNAIIYTGSAEHEAASWLANYDHALRKSVRAGQAAEPTEEKGE
jgi:hypothetical protein